MNYYNNSDTVVWNYMQLSIAYSTKAHIFKISTKSQEVESFTLICQEKRIFQVIFKL